MDGSMNEVDVMKYSLSECVMRTEECKRVKHRARLIKRFARIL